MEVANRFESVARTALDAPTDDDMEVAINRSLEELRLQYMPVITIDDVSDEEMLDETGSQLQMAPSQMEPEAAPNQDSMPDASEPDQDSMPEPSQGQMEPEAVSDEAPHKIDYIDASLVHSPMKPEAESVHPQCSAPLASQPEGDQASPTLMTDVFEDTSSCLMPMPSEPASHVEIAHQCSAVETATGGSEEVNTTEMALMLTLASPMHRPATEPQASEDLQDLKERMRTVLVRANNSGELKTAMQLVRESDPQVITPACHERTNSDMGPGPAWAQGPGLAFAPNDEALQAGNQEAQIDIAEHEQETGNGATQTNLASTLAAPRTESRWQPFGWLSRLSCGRRSVPVPKRQMEGDCQETSSTAPKRRRL